MDIWLDGICIDCGFFVAKCIEVYAMNICLNRNCKNHEWHYVKKSEKSDYYRYIDNIENGMKISFKNNEEVLNQLNDIIKGNE